MTLKQSFDVGPPLAPAPRLASNTNNGYISIIWDEPFYWPDHEIVGYIIRENISGYRVREFHTSNRSISYSSSSGLHGDDEEGFVHVCEIISLMVTTFNDIGESEPANFTTYLPKGKG